ncbi:hypothetical protein J8V57_00315 [Xenorhabdus sp. PB61.4]|uniref:hypothetical protein n=1 Tax=Xenorhabdus sp. PB61.4 TaxID=2788940 RepID=UPI001E3F2E66|nr:hypothetical protein [Xenorhabdus sp. PB61.4]MCC8364735.1 hypothetical protein [Xenorhabdus sp. PB61.4]
MSSAPDVPKKPPSFNEPFFVSGYSSGRLAVHVINNQSSQNWIGNFVRVAEYFYLRYRSNTVFRVVITQAIRANLLARAQATTLECFFSS